MRIVHTADWHIGKILNDYSLLEDQEYYFDRFICDLEKLNVDALIIAGDLYDRSIPSAEAISLLNSILCRIVLELKIQTFIVAGNHDSKERLSFVGDLLEQSGLHIAGIISTNIKKVTMCNNDNKINIFMLPYVEPHNVKKIYKDCQIKTHNDAVQIYCGEMFNQLDLNQTNILIAHGLFQYNHSSNEIAEISIGGSDMVDASPFKVFDYVALGHLHSHRTAGSEKMVYAGSPLKYSIDEASQKKSYTIIDINDKNEISISTKKITPLRDVRVIEGSFEFLSTRGNHTNFNDYIFANITDDKIVLHAITTLKSIFPNILGLKYINLNNRNIEDAVQTRTAVNQQNEQELFSRFYQSVMLNPLDENQIKYISGIFESLKGEQHDTN